MKMNIIYPLILISDSSHPPIRLHGSSRLPFLVIVDHPSEAIERGTIPPLFAGKRNALLARRLTQIFPESDYRGAFPDRRHRSFITPPTRFLFWAITDSGFLDQHLNELFSSSQPIRGIWTITQVVRMLLVDARITNRATHLIVLSSPAGTRLLAWQQQEIVLTRLITYPLSSQELKAELDRTVQYLYNQGLAERNVPISVWFWGVIPPSPDTTFWFSEPTPAAITKKLKRFEDDPFSALLSWWQQRVTFPPSLAPTRWLRYWRFLQWRRILIAGSLLLNGSLFAAAAVDAWQASVALYLTQQLEAEQLGIEKRTQETLAAISAIGIPADTLLATIDSYNAIFSDSPTLTNTLEQISDALGQAPLFRLNQLTWQRSLPQTDPAPSPPSASANPVSTDPLCPPPEVASKANNLFPRVWVGLEGSVPPDRPLRELHDSWVELIAALDRNPSIKVLSQTPPIETSPHASIKGNERTIEVTPFRLCLEFSK